MTDAERLERINELSRPLKRRSNQWKLKPDEKPKKEGQKGNRPRLK